MRIQQLTTSNTTPLWAGSVASRATLLSGGAKLDGTAFPAKTDGTPRVPSGTLLSRDVGTGAKVYTTFNALFGQHAFVWDDVNDQVSTNPDVELYVAGEVRLDRLPVALTTAQRDAIKAQFVLTIGNR